MITVPRWFHVMLTVVAMGVPWALGTLFPAIGVQVPAAIASIAALAVSLIQSVAGNASAGRAAKGAGILILAGALGAGPVLQACRPNIHSPSDVFSTVEQVVLADLQAGKTLDEVEADVARALGGNAAADVVAVVQDVLALLIDTGVLPQNIRPVAASYAAEEASKIAARPGHEAR